MQTVHAVVECPVSESFRARQVAGMFDLPIDAGTRSSFSVNLPSLDDEWSIGAIVGPSGSGKTTVAKHAFGDRMRDHWDWPRDQSVLEGFPRQLEVREITQLLGSVGFSSPPAWLRPFHLLSNGEQFRVLVARTLAEATDLAVVDEFTSVVDRTVAKIGSSAVSRAIRRSGRRFVAVSCHYDILPWLEPDWVLDMGSGELNAECRRWVRRPPIDLEIVRCGAEAWKLFSRHHYLSGQLHPSAKCFAGLIDGHAAAFVAALPFPHATHWGWREHRCVCLPDYQGVGIGNAMSEFVASLFAATGRPYTSVTSHPAMIHHRARCALWRMRRGPSRIRQRSRRCGPMSVRRVTASFLYTGPVRREVAEHFGIKSRFPDTAETP